MFEFYITGETISPMALIVVTTAIAVVSIACSFININIEKKERCGRLHKK